MTLRIFHPAECDCPTCRVKPLFPPVETCPFSWRHENASDGPNITVNVHIHVNPTDLGLTLDQNRVNTLPMAPTLKLASPPTRTLEQGDKAIRDALEAWQSDMRRRTCADKSIERMTDHVIRAMHYCGWTGVRDMTREDLVKWLDYGRTEKAWKPATINSSLTSLRSFGNFCFEAGWLTAKPFSGVAQSKNKSRGAYGCFTVDQARALLAAATRATRDGRARGNRTLFYGVLFLTGLRVEEALSLEWKDLNLETGVLTTDPEWAKNGRELAVPIAPQLLERLRAWKLETRAKPTDRVFKTVPNRESWRVDREAAGLPELSEQGRKLSRHACRATLASWLYSVVLPDGRRVSEAVVKSIIRHDQGSTHARYVNLTSEEVLAVNALPDIFPDFDPKPLAKRPSLADTHSTRTAIDSDTKPAAESESSPGKPLGGLSAGLASEETPAKGPGGRRRSDADLEAGNRHYRPEVGADLVLAVKLTAKLMIVSARLLAHASEVQRGNRDQD